MPLPIEQNCQVLLTAISQSIGQVNGMAYGCERWNVPSLRNLDGQLQALSSRGGCQQAFIDDMWVNQNAPGPLNELMEVVQSLIESYGLTDAGFEELATEEVSRNRANNWVGEMQNYWFQVVTHLTDMYGRSRQETFDGKWPGPIPPRSPNKQEVR
jgi:hypothetical protein